MNKRTGVLILAVVTVYSLAMAQIAPPAVDIPVAGVAEPGPPLAMVPVVVPVPEFVLPPPTGTLDLSWRDDQDDPAYAAYKEGYKNILSEQWDEARKHFEVLVKQYPKSKYVADSKYWMAYALKYSDKKKAIEAYKQFLEQYPKSKYYDDAVSDLGKLDPTSASTFYGIADTYAVTAPVVSAGVSAAKLAELYAKTAEASALAGRVSGTYAPAPRTEEDPAVRMKIEAFLALARAGDSERTFEMAKELLLDPKQPLALREAALVGLRQAEERVRSWESISKASGESRNMKEAASDALKKLEKKDIVGLYLQVLKSDTSNRLAPTVLYQLGNYADRGDEQAFDVLKRTALDQKVDRKLREAALMGLRRVKNPDLMNIYTQIVQGDSDPTIRQFALYQIAQSESGNEDAAFKTLSAYAQDRNQSREIREAALSSLRALKGKKATTLYLDIAKNDPDERIQEMALYLFVDANSKEPEMAFAALKEIAQDRQRSWSMRQSAMSMLARMDNDESLKVLVALAKSDPEERVRMSAISYLGHFGKDKSKSLETLISLFNAQAKDQSKTRQNLLFGIASVGNAQAVEFLGKVATSDEDMELRGSAIQLLGNIGGEKARQILVQILKTK